MTDNNHLPAILGTFLAGLGFFFFGVKTVSANFKLMAGHRMRSLATRWTRYGALAAAGGALFASITQSVTPVTFIVVSLVTSGLVEIRPAMPMVIWAGVGTSLMVFLSVLNLKLGVLYFVGIGGICFYFERPARAKHLVGALLAIGFLFYGLQMMRAGAANLENWPQLKAALQFARSWSLLLFLAGAAASLVLQSMAAVSIMAITFCKAGLFEMDDTMVAIFGASFGSGMRVWLLSAGIVGAPRQLALLQMTVCAFGGLFCLALFYLEHFTGWPLLKFTATHLFTQIDGQMAGVYFFMNVIAGTGVTLVLPALGRLFAKWSPPSLEEDLGKPQFIHEQALLDGETALDLVVREQRRLFERLPAYFNQIRQNGEPVIPVAILGSANRALNLEVQTFITELINRHPLPRLSERLLQCFEMGRIFNSLDEGLAQYVAAVSQSHFSDCFKLLTLSFSEALDSIVQTGGEAMDPLKKDQLEWLVRLTEDRSEMMEKVRKTYLASEAGLGQEEKAALLYLTNLYERNVWLLRQLGQLVARSGTESP